MNKREGSFILRRASQKIIAGGEPASEFLGEALRDAGAP
jgi:hypothetical protein